MTKAPSIKEALELTPCPFCGGKPELTSGGPGNWYVRCLQCKCTTNDVQPEHAVELWNALATLSPPAGERREAIARNLIVSIVGKEPRWDFNDMVPALTLEQLRTRIDAALASGLVQDEAGWRAMDTAPKDGTRILWSCGDDKMSVIHWPEYDLCFEGGYWMPLPAPPIRSARDGGTET